MLSLLFWLLEAASESPLDFCVYPLFHSPAERVTLIAPTLRLVPFIFPIHLGMALPDVHREANEVRLHWLTLYEDGRARDFHLLKGFDVGRAILILCTKLHDPLEHVEWHSELAS